ncbi:uncharacterized protein LOC116140371 [Pistacia vera]|uniref:uncharacterized protein LOC116140371 n=1 Tax=Pistacia vera TaxID=55513 RepID=UPI001263E02D|nr:uncharacterized protein LOC116140371 [Pistacia vera]
MVSSEDFSFPKINYPLPNFAISPSLWRVSSIVYPDSHDAGEAREEADVSRRSFSVCYLNEDKLSKKECGEEKMDMLWEDFNEEIERVVSNSSMKEEQEEKKETVKLSSGHGPRSSETMVELCCAQALQMSSSGRPSSSSTSIVVVMKILKKLFLLKKFP